MASSSPEQDPAYFGFTDLHGFKDYVGYVILCAPDMFPADDWLKPEDQMNLERAFVGLRYGLDLTATDKGETEVVARCRKLVDESYAEYKAGREVEGQQKLEEVDRLLSKIPSQ